MYRHISIPVDGALQSSQAIRWGVDLARRSGAMVELINVAVPARPGDELKAAGLSPAAKVARIEEAEMSLREEAARLDGDGLRVTTTILNGPIPSALAEHLGRSGTDLVVMATHDPGRLERIMIGSVAENVIRHVAKPVLLLLKDDTELTIRRILVPLDGSEFSERILPHAADLALAVNAEITLFTAVLPILATASVGLGEPVPGATAAIGTLATDESVAAQRDWLEAKARELRSRGLTSTTHATVHGNAGHAIVDYAKTHDVDVIAMSTHGRGAVKRLITGSVATHVLHEAHKAMLINSPNAKTT
jgi:nucleotide-binding universal stress UspA family protein